MENNIAAPVRAMHYPLPSGVAIKPVARFELSVRIRKLVIWCGRRDIFGSGTYHIFPCDSPHDGIIISVS
jgi:hypothetical protein